MEIVTGRSKSARRLAEVLGIDPGTCQGIELYLDAGDIGRLVVRRVLTTDEIDALSEWFVTEGIDPIQTGTTTYSLERREQADGTVN